MQTKPSYRALKWTLFMGIAATLASACVVSTGDGDNDDVSIEGGDGGTNNTSGTANTGGNRAGSSGSGGGGTSAGSSTAGGGTGGSAAGAAGGEADPDYPGACESELVTPSVEPSCDEKATDNDCGKCLKSKCCTALQACYGTEPTSACGYGTAETPESASLGQFDCIRECYAENNDGVKSETEIFEGCAGECLLQCESEGLINQDTQEMLDCALNGADGVVAGTDDCHDVCFPPAG
jgi:hypothetical protein